MPHSGWLRAQLVPGEWAALVSVAGHAAHGAAAGGEAQGDAGECLLQLVAAQSCGPSLAAANGWYVRRCVRPSVAAGLSLYGGPGRWGGDAAAVQDVGRGRPCGGGW